MAVEVFPDIYEAQLKALLRANDHGNLRLLYPMVSDPGDLATFRAALAKARKALRKEKVAVSDARIPEGVMVETPAAVMMADEILAEVDFINIGSNDLLQYTLAAARGNTLAEKRYHILHPSLVKLLSLAARAGRKAGKEVCLCGEIASFEEYYPLFLQAGLASFSVAVAKFNDIRCALLHVKRGKGTGLVEKYLRTKTKDEADRFFSRFV